MLRPLRWVPALVIWLSTTAASAQPDGSASFPDQDGGAPSQPLPPPPAPPASAPTSVVAVPAAPASVDRGWDARFQAARNKLYDGEFVQAARELRQLERETPDASRRAVAAELALLAETWQARHKVLLEQSDVEGSDVVARSKDRRTTDEIAVLYSSAVFYGLGSGAWIAVLTEPDNAAGGILPALGLAAGAAGGVYLLDSNVELRYGVPQSIVTGMTIGLEQGLVWSLWNQARVDRADEWEPSTVASVIWGSASAGALAGGVIGSVSGTTPGRASFVGSSSLWGGTITGLTVAALSEEDDFQDDRALLGAALGLNAGAVGGALAAGPVSPTIARVRFIDLGGIAGALLIGGLYASAADEDITVKGFSTSVALGATAGLVTGWFATAGMEPDRGAEKPAVNPPRASITPLNGGALLGIRGTL